MSSLIFYMLVAVAPAAIEPGLVCESQERGMEKFVRRQLKRYGLRASRRAPIAIKLSRRIAVESKRFKLDPLAMTAIAWMESSFVPSTRGVYGGKGNWQNEAGIWQLIPGDAPVRTAAKMILGCRPSGHALRNYLPGWKYRYAKGACKYPDIAKRRRYVGYLKRSELKDIHIGTWVVFNEVRQHIDHAKSRWKKYRWPREYWRRKWIKRNPNVDRTALARYAHYNWGHRVLRHNSYRRRLFQRYSRVRDAVCGTDKSNALAAGGVK